MCRHLAFFLLILALTGCGRNPPSAPILSAVDKNNLAVFLMEHERGDFPAAIDVLKRVTAERPYYALAWVNLGIAHVAIPNEPNKYHDALVVLDRAELLGGRWPQLYFTRGYAKTELQDLRGAEQDFRTAVRIDPKDPFVRYHLGGVLLRQSRFREAAAQFRKSIEQMPTLQPG
jgi:tetratricopeptide (TPR) repeat protein